MLAGLRLGPAAEGGGAATWRAASPCNWDSVDCSLAWGTVCVHLQNVGRRGCMACLPAGAAMPLLSHKS